MARTVSKSDFVPTLVQETQIWTCRELEFSSSVLFLCTRSGDAAAGQSCWLNPGDTKRPLHCATFRYDPIRIFWDFVSNSWRPSRVFKISRFRTLSGWLRLDIWVNWVNFDPNTKSFCALLATKIKSNVCWMLVGGRRYWHLLPPLHLYSYIDYILIDCQIYVNTNTNINTNTHCWVKMYF